MTTREVHTQTPTARGAGGHTVPTNAKDRRTFANLTTTEQEAVVRRSRELYDGTGQAGLELQCSITVSAAWKTALASVVEVGE